MSSILNAFFKNDYIKLAIFVFLGLTLGAALHFEQLWDFYNYHYYNAYAFLNNRYDIDVVPAFINSFYNPLVELPAYFLINALNEHPVLFSAIMGIPYGILLFITFKILCLFFDSGTIKGQALIGTAFLICLFGYTTFSQISTTTHEIPLSCFVLTAFYLMIKDIAFDLKFRKKTYILSGLLLGLAAGFKLTFGLYAAATGITLILFYKKLQNPKTSIALFTFFGVIGFLLTHGYWSWMLWQRYENPIFPFFNSFFKSPYFDLINYKDDRYFNSDWKTLLLYPFFMSANFQKTLFVELENTYNFRYMLVYLIFLGFIGTIAYKKFTKKESTSVLPQNAFLISWLIIVYFIWLFYFRIPRYLIPFELMLSIPIIKVFFERFDFKKPSVSLCVFFCFGVVVFYALIAGTLFSNTNPYRPLDMTVLPKIKETNLPDNTIILQAVSPSSIFVPLLEKQGPIRMMVAPEYQNTVNGSDFYKRGRFAQKVNDITVSHTGSIAYIFSYRKKIKDFKDISCSTLFQIGTEKYIICIKDKAPD